MAPVERKVDHNGLEQQLKDIVQDLYQVMVQVSTYDSMGKSSKEVLSNEIQTLSRSLQSLHTVTSSAPPNHLPSVPAEVIDYVENSRNPDIYTREFVELVRRGNQLMRGKLSAFGEFRDVLAADMAAAMPEMRGDVRAVCEATGGTPPPLTMTTAAVAAGSVAGPSTATAAAPAAAAPASTLQGGSASTPAASSSAAEAGGSAQGSQQGGQSTANSAVPPTGPAA